MNNVTIKKSILLEKLKRNRSVHLEKYKTACVGFKISALNAYTKAIKDLKKNGKVEANFYSLREPMSHVQEYDTVINMLEFSTDDVFVLTRREFENYIEDNWAWTEAFRVENAGYVGIGTSAPAETLAMFR
jgi:hypothetical protein